MQKKPCNLRIGVFIMLLMKNKICKIEGCNRKKLALDMCQMHYRRVRDGIIDMSPEPLSLKWKPDDERYLRANKNKICEVHWCDKAVYTKNLCRSHYDKKRLTGFPLSDAEIFPTKPCSVSNCFKESTPKSDFCKFHYIRYYKGKRGKELEEPKKQGAKRGPQNHNWKGGIFQYPNHSEMKRNRLFVLKRDKYTCRYCGAFTNEIHHIDNSKSNHSVDNLTACCRSCNLKKAGPHRSKYQAIYGMKLKDIAKKLGVTPGAVSNWQRSGKPKRMLLIDEIKAILF